MNWIQSKTGTAAEPQPEREPNSELEQALLNFRESVHAWSEAEFNRPRAVRVAADNAWRTVLAWALGCVVVAGGVSGGIYEHRRIVVEHQLAADRMEQQRKLAEQRKADETDESLLVNVDTDVSRSVPAAMEPLAQLMENNDTN